MPGTLISPVVAATELTDEPKGSRSEYPAPDQYMKKMSDDFPLTTPISPVVATTELADEPKGSHSEYPAPDQHMKNMSDDLSLTTPISLVVATTKLAEPKGLHPAPIST
jgi:hypothetical protein